MTRHTHTNLLLVCISHRKQVLWNETCFLVARKKIWKASTFRTCLPCFVFTKICIKQSELHSSITSALFHFASTTKHELQVIYSILQIPTSFPTLVPFDQSGNMCHNLKIKSNCYVHREYTLLYTPHTSQFVSVPWKHWKSLRILSTSGNSSLNSAGGEK